MSEPQSIHGLVALLGIPRPRLERALDSVEPVGNKGNVKLYRIADAVKALDLTLPVGRRKGEVKNETFGFMDKEKEETRLKRAMADQREMALAKTRGELVPVREATKAFGDILVAFKARMMQVPSKTAARFVGLKREGQAREKLEKIVEDILGEFSRYDPEKFAGELRRVCGVDEETISDVGPAPEGNGGPVGGQEPTP